MRSNPPRSFGQAALSVAAGSGTPRVRGPQAHDSRRTTKSIDAVWRLGLEVSRSREQSGDSLTMTVTPRRLSRWQQRVRKKDLKRRRKGSISPSPHAGLHRSAFDSEKPQGRGTLRLSWFREARDQRNSQRRSGIWLGRTAPLEQQRDAAGER